MRRARVLLAAAAIGLAATAAKSASAGEPQHRYTVLFTEQLDRSARVSSSSAGELERLLIGGGLRVIAKSSSVALSALDTDVVISANAELEHLENEMLPRG